MANDNRLGWRVNEFATAIGVSRSKAYEILAAYPELTFRIGSSVRVVPERAREWRDRQLVEPSTPTPTGPASK